MVKLLEMAQFMHDNIVSQLFRQKRNFIGKTKITFFGTTAPASFLISDTYPIETEIIYVVEVSNSFNRALVRLIFVSEIILFAGAKYRLAFELFEKGQF